MATLIIPDKDIAADIARLVGPVPPSVLAMGGAYEGADRFNNGVSLWSPPLQSADADLLSDKELLDARSRDVFRNDAYLQSGANAHKDGIVGATYYLNSKPDWEVLGLSEDWATEFQREVEATFSLWAESDQNWVDAARTNNFTSLIRLAVGVHTIGGEVLATAEWRDEPGREFKTCIQMVDCDRLSTPPEFEGQENIRAGIRHDRYGAPLSAFIRTRHPSDIRWSLADYTWKEVKFRKPWGRQQVFHIREQKRIDQTRAVSDVVAGLKAIAITKKFRDVTLQNAVVGAMYAASIESELPAETLYQQLGSGNGNFAGGVTSYASQYLAALGEYVDSSQHMQIDGVKIPHLFPGTKLKLLPAGNPGGVGQDFEKSLLRHIAATLNISYEELSKDYTSTNYSSARAAMAQTWRFMQTRKKMVADRLANAIFKLWLEEAVNNNLLSTFPKKKAAQLYTRDYLNLKFEALAGADWIGASRGQIDELKETQAAVMRVEKGLSTYEDELAKLGKDWRKVFAQLAREKKERERYGLTDPTSQASDATNTGAEDGDGNKDDKDE